MLLLSYINIDLTPLASVVCVDSGGGGRKSVRSKTASSLLPAKKEIPATNTVSNSGGKRGRHSLLSSERSSETKIQDVELTTSLKVLKILNILNLGLPLPLLYRKD